MGNLLTVAEVASRLKVSPGLVYSLIARKKIGHRRIGNGRGVLRIPEDALTAYLEGHSVEPKEEAPPPVRSRPLKHLSLD